MKITKHLRALRSWLHNWNELRSIRELTLRAYIEFETGTVKCVKYGGFLPVEERDNCNCSGDRPDRGWSRTECGWR